MIKRILLPLERGDDDGAAVRFARILSERRDVEILLLRIEEWPILGSLGGGWVPAWRSADLGLVQAGFGGRKPRILAPEAVPSATITEQAALHAASLVLFTYRREPAWIRMMYGNPTERLLHDSRVSLLAVPEAVPPRVSRILFVHEGGEAASRGSLQVIELAQIFDAKVFLLQTWLRKPESAGLFRSTRRAARPTRSFTTFGRDLQSLLGRREVASEMLPRVGQALTDVPDVVARNRIDLVVFPDLKKGAEAPVRRLLRTMGVPTLLIRDRVGPSVDAGLGSRVRVGV